MPSDKGASRFDKAKCYAEFTVRHGFHPTQGQWEPLPCEQDLRNNRDPALIGKRILGKKFPLRAADRHATLSTPA